MSFNARVSYTADGNTSTFAITFSFIDSTHVKVFLDGVATTNFTVSGSNVVMNSNPANATVVMIKRETPTNARLVDFQDGSVLTESDLDKSADQNFFIAQEINDESQSALKLGVDDTYDAQNKRIKNVADPTAGQDAVTKNYLENTYLTSSTIANINTLGAISNLGTLASNNTNVNTVATNIASVNTVANDIAKVITVANDLNEAVAEIDTVATNIANVNLVGTDIANVNTVANNLSGVNSFAERYRVQAGVPSSSNDTGDLVFDTTAGKLKVFDGSSYQLAGSSVNGTSQRFKFVATASQTTFSGADANGNTLTYDVASGTAFADIYLNGVKLDTSDFTATNGTSIVLGSGASVNDILQVVAYGTFQLASFSAGNLTSGTLPVARGGTGKTTSDLTGNTGKVLVVNSSANGFDIANASTPEVYGFIKGFTASTVIYTVTVQSVGGQNKYFINGEQQKTLELLEGNTYIFNYPSGHPFKFSTTSNGTHGGGTEYTTGVTHNSSTQVTIVVGSSAPTLYYYCSSHSGMGGQANTPVPADNTLQVVTTNQGADNITNTQYNSFTDTLFSASGFTFSIDGTTGNLIATI